MSRVEFNHLKFLRPASALRALNAALRDGFGLAGAVRLAPSGQRRNGEDDDAHEPAIELEPAQVGEADGGYAGESDSIRHADCRVRVTGRPERSDVDHPERPRRAFTVALEHPELLAGFAPVSAQWVDRFAALVLDGESPADPLRARILGSALMGMIEAVTGAWLADPAQTYSAVLTEGFAVMEPIFHS